MNRSRYEVRAVWTGEHGALCSQPTALFDQTPMLARSPDRHGVYYTDGAWLEDHATRTLAETHAAELNGQVRA